MGNKKILIVDDDPDVLQSMHRAPQGKSTMTLFFAADANSCMAEARKNEPELDPARPGPSGGRWFRDHGADSKRYPLSPRSRSS